MQNNMKDKNIFKKLSKEGDFSSCWFCNEDTIFVMITPEEEEIWCCEKCLYKIGKIRQFKCKLSKYTTFQKKLISDEFSICKKTTNSYSKGRCEVK